MFERFTDRARKVMALANQEAQRFDHEYIGTEHILLGLVKEGSGTAVNALRNLDVDPRKVRLEVEKLLKSGPCTIVMGKLPQTPRANKAIECAIEEARNMNHSYVGTEHFLLGLICDREGVAGQVLSNFGLKIETVRQEVLNLLSGPQKAESADSVEPDADQNIRPFRAFKHFHSDLADDVDRDINQWLKELPQSVNDFIITVHGKCILVLAYESLKK